MKASQRNLTLAALTAAALPAMATGTDAIATADTVMEPRTYMGETVMAAEPDYDSYAVKNPSWWSKVRATGTIQTQFLIPETDPGTKFYKSDFGNKAVLNNTYFDFTVNAPYISVGARFEWAKWPLPSYWSMVGYRGWGVPYIWATGKYKWFSVTAGDFYEQFGSGLILRTYQERSLGVDGAIRGGRIKLNPAPGVYITALGGKQRHYWEHNPAWIWGADAEWSFDETFRNAFGNNYGFNLGFSYVGKYDNENVTVTTDDWKHQLVFPKTVAAFDVRARMRFHDFNILAEYATKNNDPNSFNNYIYSRGNTVLLSASYAAKGFSALLQAKRSDNMSFRSKKQVYDVSSFINHLPAFTMTQTYALAAMYNYSTQWNGEWAFQGEVGYLFKKKTPLGGKYGTSVKLSGTYISGLGRNVPKGENPLVAPKGSNGYATPFWKIGALYYADANFELKKKLSKKFQFTFFYLFQKYNQEVIELHAVNGPMVTANTFIFEGQWKMAKRTQLRFEAQYLTTKQDKGDWISGLVELSLAPHWMFTFTDTYNLGTTKKNYYNALVTYVYKANRFTLGYGRTRDGYDCTGGVCRWVPATKGFSITYNYTF